MADVPSHRPLACAARRRVLQAAAASALLGPALQLRCAHAADEARLKGTPRTAFTDSSPERLAQTKRVAISNVVLEFQTKVFAEEITGRLSKMFLSRGNSYSDNVLAGFDTKALEAAAGQVYERLKQDLVAAGYELVPEAEITAQPAYKKLRETMGFPQGYAYGNKDGHSLVVGPASLPIYLPPLSEQGTFGNTRKTKGEQQAPEMGVFERGRMAGNSSYAAGLEVDLAKALNAHVLKAWYLVGFGQASAETDYDAVNTAHYSTTATSRTGATAQMYVRDEQTRIAVRLPDGDRGYARESKRISALSGGYRPYDGDVVVRLDEMLPGLADFLAAGGVSNATAERPTGFLGSLLGGLAGTVADQSYKTTVDPQRFADNAAAMVSAVQALLVAQLKR